MGSLLLLGAGGKGAAAGGGGGGFTPLDLVGLLGWWDLSVFAGITISSGTSISAIADQSGGGRTMNWNGYGQSTYNATGFNSAYPAVIFDVAVIGGCYQAASFPMGTGDTLTAWFVGTFTATGSGFSGDARAVSYKAPAAGQDYNNNNSWTFHRNGTSNAQIRFSRASVALDATATLTSPRRIIVTIDSSGSRTIYVDGVATTGITTAGNWVSAGTLTLGSDAAHANAFWNGPMAEAGVATGFSNATTVGQLDTYLKTKWGL